MNKKIHIAASLLLAALAFTASCEDDFYEQLGDGEQLTYEPSENFYVLSFSSASQWIGEYGGTNTVGVVAGGSSWRISNPSTWLTFTPSSGRPASTPDNIWNPIDVQYYAEPNGGSQRMSISTLSFTEPGAPSMSSEFTVTQGAATPRKITIDNHPGTLQLPGGQTQFSFTFTANHDWSIYSGKSYWRSNGGFIDADINSGTSGTYTVTITVDANTTMQSRTGYVYVHSEMNTSFDSEYIYFEQARAGLEIVDQPSVIYVDNGASQVKMTVQADAPWELDFYSSWLSASPMKGEAGKSEVVFTIAPNDSYESRAISIAFLMGNGSGQRGTVAWVKFYQAGLYMNVDTTRLYVGSAKDSKAAFYISSNTSWTISTLASWLTLDKTSGSGSDSIRVTADENSSTMARQATIVVTTDQANRTAEVTVTQRGKDITIEDNTMRFPDDAGSQSIKLMADDKWTATTDDDWITVSPDSGTGASEVTITVTENMLDEERSGAVDFEMLGKHLTLAVIQAGKYAYYTYQPLSFTSAGGKGFVEIATNDTWTVALSDSTGWLSATPASGSESANITIEAKRNNTMTPRRADIVFTTGTGKKRAIPVEQGVRYLRSNASQYVFMSDGGQLGPLIVMSDGTFSVKSTAEWLTVAPVEGEDGHYWVKATANSTGSMRSDTITVTCTDLTEGSLQLQIPVRQVSDNSQLAIEGFTTEGNWTVAGGDSFSVTIRSFTTDKPWTSEGDATGTSFSVTPYGKDKDWGSE